MFRLGMTLKIHPFFDLADISNVCSNILTTENLIVVPSTKIHHKSEIEVIDIILFILGLVINLFAYSSIDSLAVAVVFLFSGIALLLVPRFGGEYERIIFIRTFMVGWVMSGVAAVYANYFGDIGQLYSDASGFYMMASGQGSGLTIDELKALSEGSLAVVLWRAVYDVFFSLGFARERFVGIMVNVTIVAFTGVISIKMARQVYGNDPYRFQRLTLLFSGCGLFWLFAAVHLRDSLVLFTVTALLYFWISFLSNPIIDLRFLRIAVFSIIGSVFLSYLRVEFTFVPFALAVAGCLSLLVSRNSDSNNWLIILFLMLFIALSFNAEILIDIIARGSGNYTELSLDTSSSQSLGMALVVNQPLPVRLVVGSLYLVFFPIPFWSGFQLESVYSLFKSFNVLFFYALFPLFALSISDLWYEKSLRMANFLFFLFVSIGFIFAIALTSLETRHLGTFLVPIFLLALMPDLRDEIVQYRYKNFLLYMLSAVGIVHVVWLFIKL